MVRLLLLIKSENRLREQFSLPHYIKISLVVLGMMLAGHAAQALTNTLSITTTTYIDSRVSNQTLNYGRAHTVKVVIDSNVTSDGSMCRGLLQLPARIWAYSPGEIVSATIAFYVWQDNTEDRNITLYPLTRGFVQGTGSGSSPADGATWCTYDGANPWTNPGGDFDTNYPVVGVKEPVLDPDENDRFFSWDITPLLKRPASQAELRNNGALLRIDETPMPASGMPRAPFTSSYDPSYPAAYWPSLQLTIAPTLLSAAVADGVLSFAITNLTVGTTNTIERSLDLSSRSWTAVSSFVAAGVSTNWSETIPAECTKAFYRLRSQE
jgi:hypothetical protein